MNKIVQFLLMLVISSSILHGQHLPSVYNQFFMNPYIYNPAYAGVEGHSVVFFMYKQQMSAIDGGPEFLHTNFHIPLKGGLAFGAMAFSESLGVLRTTGGKVTAGYLVSVDREHFFRFGMSLGAGNNTINFSEFDSPGDPAFNNYSENSTFLIGDIGATYHFGHFNVGLSLPSLFGYDLASPEGIGTTSFAPHDNIFLKANYRGHLSDDIAIEPHLLYRYNRVLPDQFEVAVIAHIYHLVWVGGSYRQNSGPIILLGTKVKEKFGIGYSFEMGNLQFASQVGFTHEIHIGVHFGTKKEHAEHVSSFIKSHRLDAETRAKQAELERQKQLQALKASREPAASKQGDALGIVAKPTTTTTKPVEKPKNTWNYEQEETVLERVNEFGEKERGIKIDRVNAKGEKEVVFSWLPPPPPGAKSETYQIADANEIPAERTAANGTKEVGIKWIRTLDNGQKEIIVVWDPILTETQADKLDHQPSKTLGLGEAKITITAEEKPVVTEEKPVDQVVQQETVPEVNPDVVASVDPDLSHLPEHHQEEAKKGDLELTQDFRTHDELAGSDSHLEVKRGEHLLELHVGNYLVAGAFDDFQTAEDFSDKLFNRGFHDTRVGFISARGYYYVVIFSSGNLNAVNAEKQRVKNVSGMSKVWVLKVSE